jgi:hypothetical protein
MNDATNQVSGLFENTEANGTLWNYVQGMSPEVLNHLSKPSSPEVLQLMERHIMGMLGGLPASQFDVEVTTSRESLGQLIASAMMTGYFIRNVEQRMNFEQSFAIANSDPSN